MNADLCLLGLKLNIVQLSWAYLRRYTIVFQFIFPNPHGTLFVTLLLSRTVCLVLFVIHEFLELVCVGKLDSAQPAYGTEQGFQYQGNFALRQDSCKFCLPFSSGLRFRRAGWSPSSSLISSITPETGA